MVDILSCKLYLASPRKKEILGAIQNPTNQELVSQMKKYLDDEFIDPKYLVDDSGVEDGVDREGSRETSEGDKNSSKRMPSRPSGGKFHKSSLGSMPGEHYESDDDLSEEGTSEGEDNNAASDELDDSIDSAVFIGASVSIDKISIDALKGTFNSRQDCTGVSRVAIKDSELWVYYNDDINLNNVMTSVVDLVSELGMTYLEFNRLARSNNAIVFDVIKATDSVMKETK